MTHRVAAFMLLSAASLLAFMGAGCAAAPSAVPAAPAAPAPAPAASAPLIPAPAPNQGQTQGSAPTSPPAVQTPPAAAPASASFTVDASDASASPEQITVAKGAQVTITFRVNQTGTYHGGLDFRSSVVNTGTVATGTSKSVTFTAAQSFAFQPYWPSTTIAKPYTIQVTVQ